MFSPGKMSSAKNEGVGLCWALPDSALRVWGGQRMPTNERGRQMGQKKPRRVMFALVRPRHMAVLPS